MEKLDNHFVVQSRYESDGEKHHALGYQAHVLCFTDQQEPDNEQGNHNVEKCFHIVVFKVIVSLCLVLLEGLLYSTVITPKLIIKASVNTGSSLMAIL